MVEESRRDAYNWAIRALSRRMRSVQEIESGLLAKGVSHQVVVDVITDLLGMGYLDDLKFASDWVELRSARRGYGRVRLSHELHGKGVPDEVARQVMDRYLSPARETEIARKAIRKKMGGLRGSEVREKAHLYRFLRGRGFTSAAIWAALADVEEEERG
ncbi:MAG: regulatory protein RecX [bacterium]|nr:MAG: regulatory protein RecX [bacterium]